MAGLALLRQRSARRWQRDCALKSRRRHFLVQNRYFQAWWLEVDFWGGLLDLHGLDGDNALHLAEQLVWKRLLETAVASRRDGLCVGPRVGPQRCVARLLLFLADNVLEVQVGLCTFHQVDIFNSLELRRSSRRERFRPLGRDVEQLGLLFARLRYQLVDGGHVTGQALAVARQMGVGPYSDVIRLARLLSLHMDFIEG